MKTITLACSALLAAYHVSASPTANESYVAHEWGTFTSVQGADGEQMYWNPLNILELPNFVYSMVHPGLGRVSGPVSGAKTAFVARQRMETPVIYFYSERPLSVDVAVDFPEGRMTEWFPQARFAEELVAGKATGRISKGNALRWQKVVVTPSSPTLCDTTVSLPHESAGSHYYAARETDSALVETIAGGEKRDREKFLFYRGVGNFTAPLTVKPAGDDSSVLLVTNSGNDELRHIFAYEVRAQNARWLSVDRLSPNETVSIKLGDVKEISVDELRDALGATLREALTAEGLYERESAAMVKTWDDSWFAEQGTRVLYTLPRSWTDRVLPLQLTPAPRAIERVMVGRAEIITPIMERALAAEVERYISIDEADRALAVENTRKLGLGRYAEAVIRRVLSKERRSPAFSAGSWNLLVDASKPPGK